jgi:hypothetical protein
MYLRFFLSFLAGLALLLLGVFAFTWYVDPFGLWGRTPFGMYDNTTIATLKAGMIGKKPREGIILGTSVAERIDPKTVKGCTFFNAAFAGAKMPQLAFFAEEFLPPSKVVVLVLDVYLFNRAKDWAMNAPPPDFGKLTPNNLLGYGLSYGAIEQSLRVIRRWKKGYPPVIDETGVIFQGDYLSDDVRTPSAIHEDVLEKSAGANYLLPFSFDNEVYLTLIQRIKTAAEKRGAKFVLVLAPMSVAAIDYARRHGAEEGFLAMRDDILKRFPEALDLIESDLSAPEGFYKVDPVHFLPETGDALMERTLAHYGICGR